LYNKNKTLLLTYPAGKTDSTFNIPNSVTSIGYAAFSSCKSVTSVTIPNSVTSIGERAFAGCTSLTSVNIPNSVASIESNTFARTSITSITIPASVTSIEGYAFSECTNLASVTFVAGSNITDDDFGNNAFPGGDTLKTAYSTGKAGTYTREENGSTWTKP